MSCLRVRRSTSWVVIICAAFLLAIVITAVLMQAMTAVSAAKSHGDYLAMAKGLVIYGVFGFVLFSVTISLIAEIGAELSHICADIDTPADYRSFYRRELQSELLVLVPSFREEVETIWQTLMSGALAEHPQRHVVLLIDDPDPAPTPETAKLLASARMLPRLLQDLFDQAATPFEREYRSFAARRDASPSVEGEHPRLSRLYIEAANWLDQQRQSFLARRALHLTHTDRLFADHILAVPAAQLRAHAAQVGLNCTSFDDLEIEYIRLASLFRVRFSSFERKRYANLSHAPNKAMNLNSYLSLIGGAYREEASAAGTILVPCGHPEATLVVPPYRFIATIDADSLITHDFNLRLLEIMNRPGQERLAIAQSPYTAIPGAPDAIERTAAASTDGQYFTHQGLGYWGASSWVGASALMRYEALRDIATSRVERGHRIEIFVKDDVLIEDAAATIDLLCRGWRIHHDHRRLSYSATPPDFGSLIIQRRRWANGGLLIVPRLLAFTLRMPWSIRTFADAIMRIPNLTSAASNGLFFTLFMLVPFSNDLVPPWMAAVMLPSMLLTGLGLVRAGYRPSDFVTVQALSVLLVPVNLSGTFRSLRQAFTGRQTPFARTPKIAGRTPTPKRYVVAICIFVIYAAAASVIDMALGNFSHAAFAAINACIVVYCILRFIGFRRLLEDVGLVHWAVPGVIEVGARKRAGPWRSITHILSRNPVRS
jgi:cellulose synthase (UDP-forming)